MNSLRRCVVGAGAVALAAAAGGSRDAHAAGLANTRIGGEEGTVVSTNPTALLYNPGAMGFSKGSQIAVYGEVAIHHATYYRPGAASDAPDPPDAQGANTGTAHLLNVAGGPAIGGTLKLGNLVLGLGFFAPFGGSTHWSLNNAFVGSTKYPLAAGGVQRWFAMDGALHALYFTGGAAYRFGPLSIGATGNVISTTIDTTSAKTTGGLGTPDTANEGRVFVDAHTFNGSFAAGAMLEAVPDQLWIGASYQAQPGMGPQTLKGIEIITNVNGVQPFNIGFKQNLPDVVRAGVRWKLKGAPLEFRLFGDYTRWSLLKSQCVGLQNFNCAVNPDGSDASGGTQLYIPRNWNDTYAGRLGVSAWLTPEIELLIGGGYETAAIPDSTLAPDVMDAVNIQGTLGGRFKLTDTLFLSVEYTHIQYMNRDNIGKSTLAVLNGQPVQVPSIEEDAGGKYQQWYGFVNANLEALF
jgi:long-chain fatty acid transport protein